MMLLYSIVDDYGVCDRDGVGDAVASVWLIADALNGGGVWLIADASVWLIDDAAGTTVHTQLPRLAHGCAEMYTFVCTTVRNIAPPAPWLCANVRIMNRMTQTTTMQMATATTTTTTRTRGQRGQQT